MHGKIRYEVMIIINLSPYGIDEIWIVIKLEFSYYDFSFSSETLAYNDFNEKTINEILSGPQQSTQQAKKKHSGPW